MEAAESKQGIAGSFARAWRRGGEAVRRTTARAHARILSEKGQGTTEYAILVGVLVVIAIVAITLFRPKIEELWGAITDGINGL